MDLQTAKLFTAVLSLTPLIPVAVVLGWIFTTALNAMARNPSVVNDIKGSTLLYFAFTEAIGLFALVITLLILFVV